MKTVTSFDDFNNQAKGAERAFLLLYKKDSDLCRCAIEHIEEALQESGEEIQLFAADVTTVRDIHTRYQVTSVPTLLVFEKGEMLNMVKGCQEAGFYRNIFTQAVYQAKAKASGKEPKRVTVYSTPTCPWCNTLKAWLRKNGIPFTDVDVSRDENAARELVRRSGQQGVPQTDINGQIVVGFNQQKLKELLEI
ncbi:MAG TPA: thioredoxin family protein [Bacteroidales bacterium]|nr:thioredoxin family protein [Bacteroidales bacterium]HPO66687.1 thioredoxin family protein [Bacteroidales bacterium]